MNVAKAEPVEVSSMTFVPDDVTILVIPLVVVPFSSARMRNLNWVFAADAFILVMSTSAAAETPAVQDVTLEADIAI